MNHKEEDAVMNDRSEKLQMKELDLDSLENVTGGAGPKSEANVADGTVVAALGNSMYSVDIGGQTVTACISGKLRMNFVRIQPGDRVQVDVLDGRGRITYRYK